MVAGLLLQAIKTEKSICLLFPLGSLSNSRAYLDYLFAKTYLLWALSRIGGGPGILCQYIRHLASLLGRSGRTSWAGRGIGSRRNKCRRWFGLWRFLASNFSSPMRKVTDQNK
jgi:hypothetical protein